MKTCEMKRKIIIVRGNYWGKGDTIQEARKNLPNKEKNKIEFAYNVPEDTTMDSMVGNWQSKDVRSIRRIG